MTVFRRDGTIPVLSVIQNGLSSEKVVSNDVTCRAFFGSKRPFENCSGRESPYTHTHTHTHTLPKSAGHIPLKKPSPKYISLVSPFDPVIPLLLNST